MGLFGLFEKEKSTAHPGMVAASIAALEEGHRNTLRSLSSKKERARAEELELRLKETRRLLHSTDKALQIRQYESAILDIQGAQKKMQEYGTEVFSFPTMERFKDDVAAIQEKLQSLEHQVMIKQA